MKILAILYLGIPASRIQILQDMLSRQSIPAEIRPLRDPAMDMLARAALVLVTDVPVPLTIADIKEMELSMAPLPADLGPREPWREGGINSKKARTRQVAGNVRARNGPVNQNRPR